MRWPVFLPLLPSLGLGLVLALASAATVRAVIRLRVMDVPNDRSAHARPVPRGGGAGLVAALLLGVPSLLLASRGPAPVRAAGLLLTGFGLLAAVSWADDRRGLRARVKFAAQVAAALLVLAAVGVSAPGALSLPVLLAGGALALCWLLFVVNATNFIDGLNGLAAGATALCALGAVGFAGDGPGGAGPGLAAAVGLASFAGLAGFMPFNYPKARVFMGDIGSQCCGLAIGALPLLLAGGGSRPLAALPVPLMFAGILWDVLFTLGRRLRAGETLSQAHRGHLYQVASRCWLSRETVAALHWGFVLWGAAIAAGLSGRPVLAIAAVALPQLVWTGLVARRARRAGIGRWS